jgi:hypothetical protein
MTLYMRIYVFSGTEARGPNAHHTFCPCVKILGVNQGQKELTDLNKQYKVVSRRTE